MRKLVTCSSTADLAAAARRVVASGGKVLKTLPLAKALVIDIAPEQIPGLQHEKGIRRIEDDLSIKCD